LRPKDFATAGKSRGTLQFSKIIMCVMRLALIQGRN
jgi:hypothetical protein